MKTQLEKILVVGVDTVAVAKSAIKEGYKAYVADYFGDWDLRKICSGCTAAVKQERGKSCRKMDDLDPEDFLDLTQSLHHRYQIEGTLISSGLDDCPDILSKIDGIVPILGNSPETMERVRDKPEFFGQLDRLGIPYPKSRFVKSLDQAMSKASEIGYPVVVKPTKGFAGVGIRVVRKAGEMDRAFREASSVSKNIIIQEFIEGTSVSASFVANGADFRFLTMNEQLLGVPFLFPSEPLGYCGNVVPMHFSDSIINQTKNIIEKITSHFNLKGSNGIDLVISNCGVPYLMEVNPRFQGTLECVEKVLKINLVEAHIKASLNGTLPHLETEKPIFCTRLILHAPHRASTPNVTGLPEVRDIPLPGTIIERGEPICSIVTIGDNPERSFQRGKHLAESVYRRLSSAQ
ncbi:MAG: ATP-grasp domain-containing protein [Thermoproteota archaeon]